MQLAMLRQDVVKVYSETDDCDNKIYALRTWLDSPTDAPSILPPLASPTPHHTTMFKRAKAVDISDEQPRFISGVCVNDSSFLVLKFNNPHRFQPLMNF